MRNPGDAVLLAECEQVFVIPADKVVDVLDARDVCRNCGAELFEGDVAESDANELSFVAEGAQLGELILEGDDLIAFGGRPGAKSVRRRLTTSSRSVSRELRFCTTASQLGRLLSSSERDRCPWQRFRPGLGGQDDVVADRSEGASQQFIGKTVAVELGSVVVGDPEIKSMAQDRLGTVSPRRVGGFAGDLPHAVADPWGRTPRKGERSTGYRAGRGRWCVVIADLPSRRRRRRRVRTTTRPRRASARSGRSRAQVRGRLR